MILAFGMAVVCLAVLGMWGVVLAGEWSYERVRRWRAGLRDLRGVLLHPGLFYHPGHTWVMPQGNGMVRIGLDDFGRRLVDGVQGVELPRKGARVRQGEAAVQLDCGQKRARLLSPVDGVVTAVNGALTRDGSALERDPYGTGWLFSAKVFDRRLASLPTGEAAVDWMRRETGRLFIFLQGELGVTLADGGDLVPRPPDMLSDEQWNTLVRDFFRTSAGNEVIEH
ncbi:MAG: hypothetical protein A3K12_14825 [Candidatus Rokubacteria bacterium RIFCSPLOWO2_12_FULL_71_19]|nr:MAG: hypothetical protein A3K12_14825 [Candidatus Rokubacteria bacterium RIFCSPLOWO2_12_FULL_71_19]